MVCVFGGLMLKYLKNNLKKVIPPPINVFMREINRILKKQDDQVETYNKRLAEITSQLNSLNENKNYYKIRLDRLENEILLIKQSINNCKGDASEAVWAEIFNNVISDSKWLHNTSFSAGRWAVGYPYLYVMYRVLNEIRPKRILELGLGQSTRMIGQYVLAYEHVNHYVVEHDSEWIDFFKKDFTLSERSKILQMNLTFEPYKEANAVRAYEGFYERLKSDKFDFISIDAPLGGDMKQYSRIDVLKLLPGCLSEDFVIMIDDTGRPGEKKTVKEMQNLLEKSGISYWVGKNYIGQKECIVITSANLKFVCSM